MATLTTRIEQDERNQNLGERPTESTGKGIAGEVLRLEHLVDERRDGFAKAGQKCFLRETL